MSLKVVKFDDVNLDAFRKEGADVLSVQDIPGLEPPELEELKIEYAGDTRFIVTTEAEDVFQCLNPIPQTATLIFARLLFHFASTIRTAIVEIRPPDTIAYDPNCPLALLAPWLLKHHLATDLHERTS